MNKQQRQNAFGHLMSFSEYMNEQQKTVVSALLNESGTFDVQKLMKENPVNVAQLSDSIKKGLETAKQQAMEKNDKSWFRKNVTDPMVGGIVEAYKDPSLRKILKATTPLPSNWFTTLEEKQQNFMNDALFTIFSDAALAKIDQILKLTGSKDFKLNFDLEAFKAEKDTIETFFEEQAELLSENRKKNEEVNGFLDSDGVNLYLTGSTLRAEYTTMIATESILKYIQGGIPEKTTMGIMSSWIWAAIIAAIMIAIGPIAGAALAKLCKDIYNGSLWKAIQKGVYDTLGSSGSGFRETIKKLGDEAGKFFSSTAGQVVGGAIALFNMQDAIMMDSNKSASLKYFQMALDSFVPFFEINGRLFEQYQLNRIYVDESLKQIQSEVEKSKEVISKMSDDVRYGWYLDNYGDMVEYVKTNVYKIFDNYIEIIKPYVIIDGQKKMLNRGMISSAPKMTDETVLLGLFSEFYDPAEAAKNFGIPELEEGVDALVNKENPMYAMVGSLIYLAIVEAMIKSGKLAPFLVNKSDWKGWDIKQEKLATGEFKAFKIITSENPPPITITPIVSGSTLDKCSFNLTFVTKSGKLFKEKLGEMAFETGKSKVVSETFSTSLKSIIETYKDKNIGMVITGTADVTGPEGDDKGTKGNLPLSKKRSASILEYIKSKGIEIKESNTYGVGSKFAKAFTNYKGKRTREIIKKEGPKASLELRADRNIEACIVFTEEQYKEINTKDFVDKYVPLEPRDASKDPIIIKKGDNYSIKSDWEVQLGIKKASVTKSDLVSESKILSFGEFLSEHKKLN